MLADDESHVHMLFSHSCITETGSKLVHFYVLIVTVSVFGLDSFYVVYSQMLEPLISCFQMARDFNVFSG